MKKLSRPPAISSAREQKSIFQFIDWQLLFLYVVLVLIGWLSVYAATYKEEHNLIFDISQNYGKQMIWIISAFLIAIVIMIIDGKFYSAFAYIIYAFVIMLLIAVLIFGTKTSGAQSWFKIGEFKLQPSEFAKLGTNLALAKYLSSPDIRIKDIKTILICALFIIVPIILVLIQNDTGSAIVFIAFSLVLYRVDIIPGWVFFVGLYLCALSVLTLVVNQYLLSAIVALLFFIVWFMIKRNRRNFLLLLSSYLFSVMVIFSVEYFFEKILEPHQKDRINVLLGKEVDPKGVGYNINQSKIAIGSGGLFGKGYLQGTQTKYDFVPEQSTDFIFCTIGEEFGFVGSVILLLLFLWLLLRILYVAERQRATFSKIYGYGVASIIFFHFFINIGMTIGLIPVIGIPLPFISYGGSALWSFTILLFIFIRLDAYRMLLL